MGQPSVVQQSLKRRLGGKCEGGERWTLYIQRRGGGCVSVLPHCLTVSPLTGVTTPRPPTLAQTYLQGNPEGNTSLTD